MFSDAYLNTPQTISLGGGLFGQSNKQHPFDSKWIRKYHPIIENPLNIRIPRADTTPHLHSSSWGNILYQTDTSPKRISMVFPLSIKPSRQRVLVGRRKNKTSYRLIKNRDQPFQKGKSLTRISCLIGMCWSLQTCIFLHILPHTYHYCSYIMAYPDLPPTW